MVKFHLRTLYALGASTCHTRSTPRALASLRALCAVGPVPARTSTPWSLILPHVLYADGQVPPTGPSFASSALRSWSCSGTNLHAVVTDPATSALRRWSSSTYVRSTLWVLVPAARNPATRALLRGP
ncbi:unnamed protein product [Pieris brassicae]|uniref:Uncharacterized protein n=1 Tax=Pieris brassicae TaxID=7116 RepID=A0A9P0XIZ5_PIEBR|nr:unnamed protein product [Pieris brassicae]